MYANSVADGCWLTRDRCNFPPVKYDSAWILGGNPREGATVRHASRFDGGMSTWSVMPRYRRLPLRAHCLLQARSRTSSIRRSVNLRLFHVSLLTDTHRITCGAVLASVMRSAIQGIGLLGIFRTPE
jgi:hypothetical protein